MTAGHRHQRRCVDDRRRRRRHRARQRGRRALHLHRRRRVRQRDAVEGRAERAAGGNAPASSDPLDGVSTPLRSATRRSAASPAAEGRHRASGIAAAASVNHVTDVTQASLSDADVTADAIDIKANNLNNIVSATGGLAFAKTGRGRQRRRPRRRFQLQRHRRDHATRSCATRTSTLRGVAFEQTSSSRPREKRVLAAPPTTVGDIWTLAAGGAGAVAGGGSGGSGGGSGGTFAGSLAGSVSLNDVTGAPAPGCSTPRSLLEPGAPSNVRIRGARHLRHRRNCRQLVPRDRHGQVRQCYRGIGRRGHRRQQGHDRYRGARGVERDPVGPGATGGLLVEATSKGTIEAFTVAGALAAAVAKQQGAASRARARAPARSTRSTPTRRRPCARAASERQAP